MDLLVIDPLDAEVMHGSGPGTSFASRPSSRPPRAPFAARSTTSAQSSCQPSVGIDAETLDFAPVLRAVGRVSAGAENIDLEACAQRKVEVVRSLTASARAEAEFVVGAMLAVAPRACRCARSDGSLVGRELGGATVGLVGMAPRREPLGAAARRASACASSATTRRCTRATASGRSGRSRQSACTSWSSAPTCSACSSTTSAATTACSATGSCATASSTRWSSASPTRACSTRSRWRRRCGAAASPPPGSTASSPVRSIRTGRCTASRPCRSRRASRRRRASRVSGAPGRWRAGSTSCCSTGWRPSRAISARQPAGRPRADDGAGRAQSDVDSRRAR